MKVQDIMTSDPACCTPVSTVEEAAQLMAAQDCGEIPVVDSERKPLGVITDRDIACRTVAGGKGPSTPVQEVMSAPAVTVSPETSVEECCQLMEANQIRRVPVVDERGACCGIVAQSDVARQGTEQMAGHLLRDVSQPRAESSRLQ
jgi:CBS domain-containing protein